MVGSSVQSALGLSEIKNGKSVKYEHSVIHRDFDIDMYNDVKDLSPIFSSTLESGNDKLKTFSNLSEDIFLNLYKWNPQIRDAGELMPSRMFNHSLLNELNSTEEFGLLRDKCRVNFLNSAIGAEIIQTEALGKVEEIILEYKRKLQEAKRNGVPDDQLPQDIIDKINKIVEEEAKNSAPIQIDPNDPATFNMPAGGNTISKEAAQKMAELQSQIQGTAELEQLKKDISETLKSAAKQALNDVQEIDDFVQAWGIEPGGESRISVDECKHALERIRSSRELKELSNILGQFRGIAKSNLKGKSKGEGGVLKDVKSGNDIVRMLPSEKGLMSNPATKSLFKKRYTEKQCLQYEVENRKRKGMGPIVVAIDRSGSMQGDRISWAKAVALALLEVAAKQKRNYYVFFFDTKVVRRYTWTFEKGQAHPNDIIDIAEVGANGGTTFWAPIEKAMSIISKEKAFKKADITFVTDGDCNLTNLQTEELLKMKKSKGVKIQTIIINMGGHCSRLGVEDWSDSVKTVSSMADLDGSLASDIFNFTIDGGDTQ